MPRKVLQVIDSAYRCTLEEQDDPVLWITAAMRGAGGDFSVLLCENGVSYAVKGQNAEGLSFGGKRQTQPPRIDEDVARLIAKGVDVYVVEDDAAERGLEGSDLVAGVKTLRRGSLARLYGDFDQIWHW